MLDDAKEETVVYCPISYLEKQVAKEANKFIEEKRSSGRRITSEINAFFKPSKNGKDIQYSHNTIDLIDCRVDTKSPMKFYDLANRVVQAIKKSPPKMSLSSVDDGSQQCGLSRDLFCENYNFARQRSHTAPVMFANGGQSPVKRSRNRALFRLTSPNIDDRTLCETQNWSPVSPLYRAASADSNYTNTSGYFSDALSEYSEISLSIESHIQPPDDFLRRRRSKSYNDCDLLASSDEGYDRNYPDITSTNSVKEKNTFIAKMEERRLEEARNVLKRHIGKHCPPLNTNKPRLQRQKIVMESYI